MEYSDIVAALEREISARGTPMKRKQLAELIHRFLIDALDEQDERDVRAAAELRDLYDCPVCAQHIAQVYVKGIMLPCASRTFGADLTVSEDEQKETARRAADRQLRKPPLAPEPLGVHFISSPEEAPAGAQLIDVRTPARYAAVHPDGKAEGHQVAAHPDGKTEGHHAAAQHRPVRNIPLKEIALNPHIIGNDAAEPIAFMCESGTEASIAAEYAAAAGYIHIYVVM